MRSKKKTCFRLPGLCILTASGLWLSGCASLQDSKSRQSVDDGLFVPERIQEAAQSDFAAALAHFSMGLRYEFSQEPELALRQFRLAIEKDPDNETLYLLASQRLVQAEHWAEAFELMEVLLARKPDSAQGLLWISRMHLMRQELPEARGYLLRLTAVAPELEVAHLEAARLLLLDGREAEAIGVTRRGIPLADENQRLTQLHAELLLRAARNAPEAQVADELFAEARRTLADGRRAYPEHQPFYALAMDLAVEEDDVAALMMLYGEQDRMAEHSMESRNELLVHFVRSMRGAGRAEQRLRGHLAENPDSHIAHFLQGLIHELNGRLEEAVVSYERALLADEDDIHALRKIAVILYSTGSPQRAVDLLAEGLGRHPDQPELLRLAGGFHMGMENYAAAAASFTRLDQLRRGGLTLNEPLQFRTLYAMSLLATDRVREALPALVYLTRENPDVLEDVWRHQIRLAFLAEDDQELRNQRELTLLEALELLADRLPEQPFILRLAGRTHSFRQEYDRALEYLRLTQRVAQGLEDPEQWLNADFYFDMAAALERTGEEAEAEVLFERVIGMDPQHAHALNYLAYMWAEQDRNLDQALTYVQRALRMDPENGAYIDTRGWIYYRQGRFEEAYRDLVRASELEPDESVIAEHVGDVLVKLGRPVEAVAYYRIALDLGADEREAQVRASLQTAKEALSEMMAERRAAARAEAEAQEQIAQRQGLLQVDPGAEGPEADPEEADEQEAPDEDIPALPGTEDDGDDEGE